MKKFFALLFVVAALTAVNGCKKSEEPAPPAAPPATAEQPAETGAAPAEEAPAEQPAP